MASWFTALSVGYLIWYGWRVFVQDKGNPGGLALGVSVIAWGQLLSLLIS